jgi:hypothetical protein
MRGRYRTVSILAFLGMIAAIVVGPLSPDCAVAYADVPPSGLQTAYPTCGAKSPTSDDVAAAKKTFELGNRYMSEADYDRAILYFGDAYRSDCTAHKLLGFIARAHELRGDRSEAVHALETYLERAPRGDDRPTVEKRIMNLKAQIAAQAAAPSASAVAVSPPAPTVETKTPQTNDTPVSEKEKGHTIYPWIALGTGVSFAAIGTVLAIVGSEQIANSENACANRNCGTNKSLADSGNAGRTQVIAGGFLAGAGVLAIAGGLVWHFMEPVHTRSAESSRVRRPVTLAPVLSPSYAGGTFEYRF